MLKHIAILLSLFLPLPAISQIFEYAVPEKLPSAVNTDEEESSPLLSMDGSKLFFTRLLCPENIGGKYTGSDIWSIDHIGTTWGTADNIKINLNNKNNNAVIGMSTAGDVLYLMDASSTSKINGIYISKRVNEMWTKSELIPLSGIESDGFVSFYASPELDVLFVSMNGKDSKGEEDLYVCIKEDSAVWSKPKNLGSTINTSGFEISPFLSADKRRLYFSSNGHPGLGDADIFYSDRLYDSWETWSIPKNLGTNINSTNFDAYFSQYGDSVAYFTSNRQSELSNIFKSKVASLLWYSSLVSCSFHMQ